MHRRLKTFVRYYELKGQLVAEGAKVERYRSQNDRWKRLKQFFTALIAELDLNVRANNCMRAERIRTIADLVGRSEDDLLEIHNLMRPRSNRRSDGLHFGMDPDHLV